MKHLYLILLVFGMLSCKNESKPATNQAKNNTEVLKPSALIDAFKYKENAAPIISVHRGGKGLKNYPENSLETLIYINDSISAIYEIDVAKTKDGVLVLLHDNSLDRTSTGTGNLTNYTYNQLLDFNLKDDYGTVTNFKIPLFSDVLKWAKANAVVLTVDIKKSVATKDVISAIRTEKAEDVCVIITYTMEQAHTAYKLAPDLLLSVSARNTKEFNRLLQSSIPPENMFAFTGTRLSLEQLYASIHNKGIKTILGTLGNLDKQAETKGDSLYALWHQKGIDVFATDRPFAAARALQLSK
ncbi:glycerophosphodiester phosphodiesterase family protein [Bizionia gelidisalsuginis]|uniref:Glycerophosphodiester phosphodiesterase family protein n=1 Tax=Bizionia gelidisalsuginis TaxID=291188 RepID=A0ABY3MC79_9FLAO|nr:glycerophosphodiester phosphodiesterase family protein [Bizionia gelidisalsuginis]TYC14915.1 glycerophosphodiester phosphodiesterase family protein [Bizionia gelidisalsuginis]